MIASSFLAQNAEKIERNENIGHLWEIYKCWILQSFFHHLKINCELLSAVYVVSEIEIKQKKKERKIVSEEWQNRFRYGKQIKIKLINKLRN